MDEYIIEFINSDYINLIKKKLDSEQTPGEAQLNTKSELSSKLEHQIKKLRLKISDYNLKEFQSAEGEDYYDSDSDEDLELMGGGYTDDEDDDYYENGSKKTNKIYRKYRKSTQKSKKK